MLKRLIRSSNLLIFKRWYSQVEYKPYKIKSFEQINLGDVISCHRTFKHYVIFSKIIRTDLYKSKGVRDSPESITEFTVEYLEGELLEDYKRYQINNSGGSLTPIERKNTEKFQSGIIFGLSHLLMNKPGPSHLLVNKSDPNKFIHTNKLETGYIVQRISDSRYFKILDYHKSTAYEYGDNKPIDSSYYNVIEVDPKDDFKTIGKEITAGVGDYTMTDTSNFVVLEE
jgi:hypothetical protein